MSEGGVLRELAALFSIQVDSEKLEQFDRKLDGIKARVVEAGKVIVEALAIDRAKEFFEGQIEAAARLQDLATKLNVAAVDLRAFDYAAMTAGVDSESAAQALGFLSRSVGQAAIGGGEAQQAFAKLGISIQTLKAGDLHAILLQAADGFAKLKTQPERAALAMQLFGRSSDQLLPILAAGRDKLADLYKEEGELGNGLTDFYGQAREARESMERFGYTIQSIKDRITAAVLPAVVKFFDALKSITVRILDFDKRTHAVTAILQFLATIAAVRVVVALKKVAEALGLAKVGMRGFLSAIRLAGPTAMLYGLYLILEDIVAWARGGKSLIGDALDKFFGANAAADALGNLRETLHEIGDDIDSITKGFGDLTGEIDGDGPGIVKALELIAIPIHGTMVALQVIYHTLKALGAIGKMGDSSNQREYDEGKKEYLRAGNRILQDLGIESSDATMARVTNTQQDAGVSERIATAYAHAGLDPSFHLAPGQSAREVLAKLRAVHGASGGAPGASVQQTTTVTVNVQGGRDPKQTGKIVGQGAATEVEKANNRALQSVRSP